MQRRFWVAAFTMAVLVVGAVLWATGQERPPSHPASIIELIEQAYHEGRIDLDTRLLQRIRAYREPERLLPQFRRGMRRPVRCATDVYRDAHFLWRQLRPSTRAELAAYVTGDSAAATANNRTGRYSVPPISYNSPGGHFKIWYVTSTRDKPDLTDANNNGVPDYVETVGSVFDNVWHQEIGVLGYDQPPVDYPAPPRYEDGGDARYDVYIADIIASDGSLGIETPERSAGDPVRYTKVSYILFENDFRNTGFPQTTEQQMEVTAAHEFFHAIQDAYDSADQGYNWWYYEASSTWMEDEVYNDINAYLERLPAWFKYPETSLDLWTITNPLLYDHPYGSVVWNKYLSDRYGGAILREVWETLAAQPNGSNPTSIDAFDSVLSHHGSSRNAGLTEFYQWNFLSGPNDDGNHYREGATYPTVFISQTQTHESFPATNPSPLKYPPDHLASNYTKFVNDVEAPQVEILSPRENQNLQVNRGQTFSIRWRYTEAHPVSARIYGQKENASGTLLGTPVLLLELGQSDGSGKTLAINFDGADNGVWSASVIVRAKGDSGAFGVRPVTLDARGKGAVTLSDWEALAYAVLVVGSLSTTGGDFSYTYSAATDASGSADLAAGENVERTDKVLVPSTAPRVSADLRIEMTDTGGLTGSDKNKSAVKVGGRRSAANKGNWSLELVASSAGLKDSSNLLGATTFGWGDPTGLRLPAVSKPPARPGLDLVFLPQRPGEGPLDVDLRRAVRPGETWEVLVSTNLSGQDVTVSWPDLTQLPKDYGLTLTDKATGERRSMRTATHYTFRSGPGGVTLRPLSIQLSLAGQGALRLSNVLLRPIGAGRTSAAALVSYLINKDARIRVRILSPAGRLAAEVPLRHAIAGMNQATWDGRLLSGRPAARGAYLVEILAEDDEGQVFRVVRPLVLR